MKYLAIVKGVNEPDNNTPAEEVWCKVVDSEPSGVAENEDLFADELGEDYDDVEVELRPLTEFDEWVKVSEVW